MSPLPLALLLAVAWVAPAAADAVDSLPAGRRSLAQVSQFVRYDRYADDIHGGRLGLSARVLLGGPLGYGLGVDLEGGATEQGGVYNLELWPVGVGLRLGEASYLAVSAGVGVGGAGGGVQPTALQLPVELRGRGQLGPVRATGWITGRAAPLSDERSAELEGGLGLGWGRQSRFWRGASAGSGPYLAVAARTSGEEAALAVTLGVELLGAN